MLRNRMRPYHSPPSSSVVLTREEVEAAALQQQQTPRGFSGNTRLAQHLSKLKASDENMGGMGFDTDTIFTNAMRNAVDGDGEELEDNE